MRKLRAPTRKPIVCNPVWPNAGVEAWYRDMLDKLIAGSEGELIADLAKAWAKTPPIFGSHITNAYDEALAAGVMLFDKVGRVLLLRRRDGLGWGFPGGGVEYGEHTEQTAQRELYEETGLIYNDGLHFERVQPWEHVLFSTYSAHVEQFTPTLNNEHDRHAWVLPADALGYHLHPGVRATLEDFAGLAMDAPSPTKALQIALQRWGTNTVKRFDLVSLKISSDFAARNMQATQTAVISQLKQAGFAVAFKPTRASIEAYRAVVAENVGLIKSIPRKWHEQVEQRVWQAVRQGSDLNKLSTELRKSYGSTIKRAALIATDQNAKAKATIERVRQMELGITRGFWMHSNAGKEPRPVHINTTGNGINGKVYDLAKGAWDADEQQYVHPGQLIKCRCTNRPIIEGFED